MELLLKKNELLEKIRTQKEKKKQTEFNKNLVKAIEEVKLQIESVESRFNLLSDSDLVESMIFEERALKARYTYLMGVAKEKNVFSDTIKVQ